MWSRGPPRTELQFLKVHFHYCLDTGLKAGSGRIKGDLAGGESCDGSEEWWGSEQGGWIWNIVMYFKDVHRKWV